MSCGPVVARGAATGRPRQGPDGLGRGPRAQKGPKTFPFEAPQGSDRDMMWKTNSNISRKAEEEE